MSEVTTTTPSKGKRFLTTAIKVLKAIAQVGAGLLLLKKAGAVNVGAGVEKAADIANVAATVAETIGNISNE